MRRTIQHPGLTWTQLAWVAVVATTLALLCEAAYGQEATPPAVQGTGLDSMAWVLDRFGIPGLVGWIAWRIGRVRVDLPPIPVEVTVRLHPEDVKTAKRLVREVAEIEDSESTDPTPAPRTRRAP